MLKIFKIFKSFKPVTQKNLAWTFMWLLILSTVYTIISAIALKSLHIGIVAGPLLVCAIFAGLQAEKYDWS